MLGLALLTFGLPWLVKSGAANPYLEVKELWFTAIGWGLVLWRHFRPIETVGQWRNPWTVWVAGWVAGIGLWKFHWLYLLRSPGTSDFIYNAYSWIACMMVIMALLLAEALSRVYLSTEIALHTLTQWMCLSGLLVAAYGLCQSIGWDQWFHHDGGGYATSRTMFGAFGNTGYYAIYLALLFPLYFLFASPRFLMWVVVVSIALWLTKTPYAWGVAGLGLVASCLARWWTRMPRWGRLLSVIGVISVVGAGLFYSAHVLLTDERLPLWKDALTRLQTTTTHRAPSITGYGLDTFAMLMGDPHRFAHNEWIQLLVETGVVGVGLVMGMVWWSLKRGWRAATRSVLISGWFGVWIAFLAASLVHFPAHLAPIAFVGLCAWAVMEREERANA